MNKFENAINQLKKGIQSYVTNMIDNAPFDKTTVGVVNSINNNNLYTVTIDKITYNNLSCMFKGMVNVGDYVKIKIPQNNYNLMYIEGKLNATVESGGGGTTDYNNLSNKPQINGNTLSGNMTTSQLGINIPTKTSDLTNDSGYITINDLPSIDDSLSTTSENAVQNKVITTQINTINSNINTLRIEKQDNLYLSIANGQICVTYEEE